MKILHIINSLETGGAEKLLVDTLSLYAARGLKVDLLLLNGVRHPFLEELAQKNCCRIFSLGTSSLYHPKYIFKIIPFLRKYDLAHIHLFPANYYAVLAKIFSGSKIKLIFTEHNSSNRRMASPFFRKLDSYFYNIYSKVVAISDGVKMALSAHIKDASKIVVIENGVNLARVYKAPLSADIKLLFPLVNTKLLLQVGGFRLEKDQDTTIRSLLHLPDTYHLLLVGDGARKKELSALVSRLSLHCRVHFLGKRTDVFSILKSVDCVVVSSHWEGFGLAAVEGMAAGKPVVASNVTGVSDVLKGAGILFPLGDDKKLAAEIIHLCEDKAHYDKIVEQCLSRAQQYDISTMVAKHISLYEELTRE